MSPQARLRLFRFLAVIGVPAVLLLGLEGLLRVAGSGRPVSFLIADAEPGFLRTNPDYLSLYLPGSFDLRPLNFRIAARKPAGTLRIVILGESAAQGIPDPMFGFAQHLRAQLRARHPDRRIEVINTGVVAINSHVVRRIAREMAACEPDLFVVYLGNNEVVGPYAPGCSYLSAMPPRWAIRLSLAVRATRTGQLLSRALGRFGSRTAAPAEWGGMAMFVDTAVRGDDPRLEKVYANFAANLDDIIAAGTEAGAAVVLATVVSNLKDSPPFLSLNRPDLTPAEQADWRRAFERGRLEWQLGEPEAAKASLRAALRLDPQFAEAHWLLGQVEMQAGNIGPARRHFLAAQRWDALRFRPDPRLNEIIREAVSSRVTGVTLVDTALLLGSDLVSTAPPAGRELLLEHVHFDWEGNYRVGLALAEAAEGALGLTGGRGQSRETAPRNKQNTGKKSSPADSGEPAVRVDPPVPFGPAAAGKAQARRITGDARDSESRTGQWLGAERAAATLGYTAHARANFLRLNSYIVQQPPFANQITYPEDQARVARELAAAQAAARSPAALAEAETALRAAIASDPENPFLAKLVQEVLDDRGDLEGALAELRRAQALQPGNFALRTDEAIKLARLGRLDEAERILRDTYAGSPSRDRALMLPAFTDLFIRAERIAEGRAFLSEALEASPSPSGAPQAAARILLLRARLARMAGDRSAAESDLRAARQADPRDPEALDGLVVVLKESGRTPEADAEIRLAVKQQPRNHANNLRAALLAEARGDEPASIEALRAAMRSGPVNSGLVLRLARQLYNAGDRDESLLFLAQARRLAELEGDVGMAGQISRLIAQIRREEGSDGRPNLRPEA